MRPVHRATGLSSMKSSLAQALGLILAAGLVSPRGSGAPATAAGSEALLLSHTRQLTYEGKRSGEGYFSPDGKALIFQSEREPDNPFYQIYLLDLESGDTHRISPGWGKTTCAFFRPGSDQLLFASTHLDPEARAKQKAELDRRATGQQRRYSWDYVPRRPTRRLLLPARCLPDEPAFRRGIEAAGDRSRLVRRDLPDECRRVESTSAHPLAWL